MRILISNDDGVHSRGLAVLVVAARRMAGAAADITVVAPHAECSASSQRITLGNLIVHRLDPAKLVHEPNEPLANAVFAVEGSPADCVRLALAHGGPMHRRQAGLIAGGKPPRATGGPARDWLPDLVLSGINNGANVGHDIRYSGTVAAATEAACYGVPAVALSRLRTGADLIGTMANEIAEVAGDLLAAWLADGTLPVGNFELGRHVPLLNVNFPAIHPRDFKGLKITRQAGYYYDESFEHVGRGAEATGEFIAMRLGSPAHVPTGDVPTDQESMNDGYISVTPLQVELTRHAAIDTLSAAATRWPFPPDSPSATTRAE